MRPIKGDLYTEYFSKYISNLPYAILSYVSSLSIAVQDCRLDIPSLQGDQSLGGHVALAKFLCFETLMGQVL